MFFLADIVAVLNDPGAPSAIRRMVETALNAQSSNAVGGDLHDRESSGDSMVGAAQVLAKEACYLDPGERAIGDGLYYLTEDGKRALHLEDLELFGGRAEIDIKKRKPVH